MKTKIVSIAIALSIGCSPPSVKNANNSLEVRAALTAYREVEVYAKATGFVKTLQADMGSFVKQGQVLATLDARGIVTVRAPFDGVIRVRHVSQGAYLLPVTPLFTLQEQRRLRLFLEVPAGYQEAIKPNDSLKFKVKAFPSEVFSAKIIRGSEHLELEVGNRDFRLMPGMVATTTIVKTD